MKETTRFKNHPLLSGDAVLPFEDDEMSKLTPQQQANAYLTKLVEEHDPIKKFRDYFYDRGVDIMVRRIQTLYVKMVVGGTMSEEQFTVSLISVMRLNYELSESTVLKFHENIVRRQSTRRSSGMRTRKRSSIRKSGSISIL